MKMRLEPSHTCSCCVMLALPIRVVEPMNWKVGDEIMVDLPMLHNGVITLHKIDKVGDHANF